MAFGQRPSLEIRPNQSMVMTEALQQSIKLLQLSAVELNSYIACELEKNPLLSQNGDDFDSQPEDLKDDLAIEEEASLNEEIYESELSKSADDNIWGSSSNPDYSSEGALTYNKVDNRTSANYDTNDSYNIEDNASKKTLKEHLLEQIYLDIACPTQRMIALNITDLLTESGYIEGDLALLAKNIGISYKKLEQVLQIVQGFDPAGVFARNLSECLMLQLKDQSKLTKEFELLLSHLTLLADGKLNELKKICGINDEKLASMIKVIKSLDPKPGSKFISEIVNYMIPEVFVRREKGRFILELNNEVLPKLLVNRRYYAEVRKKVRDKEEQKYLSDHLYTANWLIKALDQRAQTILKVATEIITRQQEFFEKGIMFLKPMTLKTLAENLNLHESTISRVTTNKFMATPCGLFEMKYFFSSKLESDSEDNCSSTTVKYLIKALINNETTILSDQEICEILHERNINVARRTVAKYREELNIAPSSVRRKEKKIKINEFLVV
jgi:RNA polymerase sigma-54 factor